MPDLEAAADLAILKVKAFEGAADEAEESFATLREEVEEASRQLAADWTRLETALRTVLEKAPGRKAALAAEAGEAVKAVDDVTAASTGIHTEAAGALEGPRPGVSALAEDVESTARRIAGEAGTLQELAQRFGEHTAELQEQLERTVSSTREFLEVQIPDDMRELRGQIAAKAAELDALVLEECRPEIDEKLAEWTRRVDELQALFEDAFAETGEHVQQVAEFSLSECALEHLDVLNTLGDLPTDVEKALDDLDRATTRQMVLLEEAKETLESGLGESAARLRAATTALGHVKELLARYSFVQL